MAWLAENAKKLVGLTAVVLGLTAGIVSLFPGCEGTVGGLLNAKKSVQSVEPAVPGSALPAGVE